MADKTAVTIDAYDKSAGRYAEKFMNYDPYACHVAEFAALLDEGATVLDVGCGPGNTARQLYALKRIKLTGIDLSQAMVDAARLNVPAGDFYRQDVRLAEFAPESFDAVVLSFCIVHLQDDEAQDLLRRAINWIKKSGLLYLSFMEGKLAGFETTSFSANPVFFNYFPGNELESLLNESGMRCFRSVRQEYLEPDGSKTTDVFIFARKI